MDKRSAKSKGSASKMLTEVELELMSILWRLGEGSVSEVIEQLPIGRDLAYTSVSTILRILEQKKILTTRKEGRGHVYIPHLLKPEYEARAIRHVVDRVFDGAPIALVKQLIDVGSFSVADLDELKKMLSGGKK